MSPSHNHSGRDARRAGFTLTEVLVAIAIFITVISGVFALYSGAVATVRQGNQALTLNADGRVALKVMEDDLRLAYTGREFGDAFQFYGRPEGFMMVGKLSTGTEGRVTYVINPNAAPNVFDTELQEPYADTRNRVWTQVYDAALAIIWPVYQGVGGSYDAAKDLAIVEANAARDLFLATYALPASGLDTDPAEFPVRTTSYAMLRYEEPDRRDLETFDLPKLADGSSMNWPSIDANDSANDIPNNPPETTPDGALYYFLKSALGDRSHEQNAPNPVNNDLRDLAANTFSATGTASYIPANKNAAVPQLNAIGADFVELAVADKRREFWIRLLADDPTIVQPDAGVNDGATGFAPRFWTNDPADSNHKYIKDRILTERILNRATLLQPDGSPFVYRIAHPTTNALIPVTIDALKVPGVFAYGFDKTDFSEGSEAATTMNTLARINSYPFFFNDPSPQSLTTLDNALTIMLANGGNSPLYAGTPIVPRLPALVQVRFWIADEKVLANAADFRRLFVQVMDVPAGAGAGVNEAVRQQAAAQG